jgi:hypothetical protein
MTLFPSRPVFRVLALDGGGMRGLYTAAAQAARVNIQASEERVGALTLLREIFADALRSETWHQTWRKADN